MFFFFFSSRRRHTRSTRDWSSDVCSSDLALGDDQLFLGALGGRPQVAELLLEGGADRSEERRVGKECRYRRSPYHEKKKRRGTDGVGVEDIRNGVRGVTGARSRNI